MCHSASMLHSRSARYNGDQPDTTGSGCDIALWTVRQLLGAYCLKGTVYILSLVKHKSCLCSCEFPHFLSMMTSKVIRKILRKRMRNAAMAKMVNSVIHCNTNQRFLSSSSGGCSKGFIYFWSTIVVQKVINFNLSLSLCCADTASVG